MRVPLPATSVPRSPEHLGEVIETSTTEYVAQCFAPEDLSFPTMPALGSWLRASDEAAHNDIYGVVCHTTTLPIDTVHRTRPLGLTTEQLQAQQPQIFAMLRTEFRVVVLGFEPSERRGGLLPPFQYLPPRPPQIHQGVFRCDDIEIARFCRNTDFLRTLLQVQRAPTDELIAAVLRCSAAACAATSQSDLARRQWLLGAGRSLAILLRDDYERLKSISSKLQIH
ncbi:hypothetical protein [Synechococcus sp. PCC 7336]|uniref:hypothetical protein n=1 Tax=Synechococcus sp. PCC 7336 TaxID=195250 RepID=UPI00034CD4F7|nr:hypothetical protein [Synechococcus sp. PCC 7336]